MHGRWVPIVVAMVLVLPVVSGPNSQSVSEDAPDETTTGCPTAGDPVAPSGHAVSSPASAGRAPLPDLPSDSGCDEEPVPLDTVEQTVEDLVDRSGTVSK